MNNAASNYLQPTLRDRFDLFKMIRRHRKLAEKRSISYEQNKAAKVLVVIASVFVLVYLGFIAVMLSLLANETKSITTVEFICALSPFVLIIDFGFRFIAQEIPAQLIKPYIILPISRYTCIDNFIGTSLLSTTNFTWFTMLVPYILMSVLFSFGLATSLGVLLFYWLLILINTQWYHIARTLINDSMLWWLLPLGVYGLMAMPWYVNAHPSIEHLFTFYAKIGTAIGDGSLLPCIGLLLFLGILVMINRKIQYVHVMSELMNKNQKKLKLVNNFSFFERYGEIGHYLQLEIKQILRNKNPRKSFIAAISLILVFSLVSSFSNVYDNPFMMSFIGCYNFVIFGAMIIIRIMSNEGNYIDGLMVHKENIYSLLRAKYIFYSVILILPFLLMLPTVFAGKWTILMLLAYATFTAGFQYFILFQMAVFNKRTQPMNSKYINKGGIENNYIQMIASMTCLFLPTLIITILHSFASGQVVYISMIIFGSCFIVTSNLWLRNIYNRMMRKRYSLLEGFQSTR